MKKGLSQEEQKAREEQHQEALLKENIDPKVKRKTHDELLEEAQKALLKSLEKVKRTHYPAYHLAAPAGWMNDPNGVIFYKGYYHVFYQHTPSSALETGIKCWGHARSPDLIHWEHLPLALVPSEEYDRDGCFSGCAVVDNKGQLVILYTGHRVEEEDHIREVQCLAVSDDEEGIHFQKRGVVISSPPEEGVEHFRDPRVWKEEDLWHMIVGYRIDDNQSKGIGKTALYTSSDLYSWQFHSILAQEDPKLPLGKRAYMWECPDFFALDTQHVLLYSPQGLDPSGYSYRNLYENGYLLGQWQNQSFSPQTAFQEIDLGHDFYAAQHIEDPKGRQLLIAWFDMWEKKRESTQDGWAGMMSLIREMHIQDNRIHMSPPKELEKLRLKEIQLDISALTSQEKTLALAEEKLQEIYIEVDLSQTTAQRWGLKLHVEQPEPKVTHLWIDSTLKRIFLSRNQEPNSPQESEDCRSCPLPETSLLSLRLFLDRPSCEVFVGDGHSQGIFVLSSRIFPHEKAKTHVLWSEKGTLIVKKCLQWNLKDTFEFTPF